MDKSVENVINKRVIRYNFFIKFYRFLDIWNEELFSGICIINLFF